MGEPMPYFDHHHDAVICLHPVGTVHYTVVYLDPELQAVLPLKEHPRLRIEADVSGVPVKGAWQPAGGRWYLMLPKVALRKAGLKVGSPVDVAFKVIAQDDVDVPPELQAALSAKPKLAKAWAAFTAGQQRGLAHMVASAQRPETRQARLQKVLQVVAGDAPLPWLRK
jgi:Bacteriocin-protection, YdeI or OmpD-Associated